MSYGSGSTQCPKCGAVDQYGDSCEVCGSTYRATDLKDPVSVVSGQTPTLGKSVHYMVTLGAYADKLKPADRWAIVNYVRELQKQPLLYKEAPKQDTTAVAANPAN